MQINATELTKWELDPDGTSVRMGMRDRDGTDASVVLPIHCVTQLLMTLPSTIEQALRRAHRDSSLRLVHALENFRLELGEPSPDGARQLILTMSTGGGFSVAFSMSEADLAALGGTTSDAEFSGRNLSSAARLC